VATSPCSRNGTLHGQVYLPVHVLPLLLFNSPRLARFPLATTTRAVEGVLRSATFLAVYCSLGWLGLRFAIPAAVASTAPAPPSPLLQVAAGHAAGALCALALLLEKPSRRIELALYVAMQAVRTIFNAHLKVFAQDTPLSSSRRTPVADLSRLDFLLAPV
jgi:hypothetical protein